MDVIETTSNTGRGVGNRLKQARESKGLSVDEVSTELCILKRHIEAIERDDFDSLPQAAFTRGFVLSYAKHLKLDADSILHDFEAAYPKSQPSDNKPLTESIQTQQIARVSRNQKTKKANFGRYGMLLAILGLVGLGFFYYNSKHPVFGENTVTPAAKKVSTLDSMREQDGLVSDDQVNNDNQLVEADNTPTNNESGATDNVQANANNTASTTPAAPVVVDPNAAPAEVVFWVRKNTDITITDQTGQVVMSGIKSRGEHKATGKPPFQINISAAKNVELNLDKVPQRKLLRQSTQADGSAKFTLSK